MISTRRKVLQTLALTSAAAQWPALRASAADSAVTLKLSLPVAPPDPMTVLCKKIADVVEQESSGSLKIEAYYAGSLAKQQESIEGLLTGTVDMTLQTTAWIEGLAPSVQILDMPFLFKDRPTAQRVLDGPIGKQLTDDMAQKGITILAWGTNGWRQMSVSPHAIHAPADLRGIRMRIQNGPVYVSMFKALSAAPTVIDNSEVLTALLQHTVDGVEAPLPSVYASKQYQALKFVALTQHLYNAAPLSMGKRRFDSLSPRQREILSGAVTRLLPYWRALYVQADTGAIQSMRTAGLAVNPVDVAPFAEAMKPVYEEFRPKIGAALFDKTFKAAGA